MTFTKFARLAALGAWAVTGGLVLAYVAFVFILTRPNGEGIDRIESWIAWISVAVVGLALQATQFVFARMLGGIASGQKYSIESSWPSGSRS